jgi:hypothetical protein
MLSDHVLSLRPTTLFGCATPCLARNSPPSPPRRGEPPISPPPLPKPQNLIKSRDSFVGGREGWAAGGLVAGHLEPTHLPFCSYISFSRSVTTIYCTTAISLLSAPLRCWVRRRGRTRNVHSLLAVVTVSSTSRHPYFWVGSRLCHSFDSDMFRSHARSQKA